MMIRIYFLIASAISGGYWFPEHRNPRPNFPYGFNIGLTAYWFRFQWVANLMFWIAKDLGLEPSDEAIIYSNKVWRAWKLKHNIAYRLHYKYDRPYGMGIYAEIPYRWTYKHKLADKVTYRN